MNEEKVFRGQQEQERFLYFFRHHWIVLLRLVIYFALFVATIVSVVLNWELIKETLTTHREARLLFFIGYLGLTIVLHKLFLGFLNYFLNIGIITNLRVIDHQRTLFLRDTYDSLDASQIQNIEKIENGLIPTLLEYGDIKIFLAASDAIKSFYCVPNVKFHFHRINQLKEYNRAMQREHRTEKLLGPEVSEVIKSPAELESRF